MGKIAQTEEFNSQYTGEIDTFDSPISMFNRNPDTGAHWMDEAINHRAHKKGQWKYRGRFSDIYRLFDREGYIADCLNAGKPFVVTWESSAKRLECRTYPDIYGVSDLFGIDEIPTLFSGVKGMKHFRLFLIPYLIIGYDIPEQIERDPERLVPFTAKDIETIAQI